MYKGPIKLPKAIQESCRSLINLGSVLNIYSISMFIYAMDVYTRIVSDKASILDLQDVIRLCDAIIDSQCISNCIVNEITEFKNIIQLFITTAIQPDRPCGLWMNVILEFDDDQKN